MVRLADSDLHTDYTNPLFRNPNGTSPTTYDIARNNYIAKKENAVLFSGGTTLGGQNITRIHNDSEGLPTLGYGFNLAAFNYAQIDEGINFALGPLSTNQKNGLKLIKEWKDGTRTAASIIGIAQGTSGTTAQKTALQSITMTHDSAIVLLDAMLDGSLSFGNYENRMSNFITTGDVTKPGNPEMSTERVGLLSAYYNNPGLIGPGMKAALLSTAATSRAEAWFQLRYNHQDYNTTLQARRAEESNLIHLTSSNADHVTHVTELKVALNFLFNGKTTSGALSVYKRSTERDVRDPFTTAIKPELDELKAIYAPGKAIDFVQMDKAGTSSTITPGIAEGKTASNTNNLIFGEDGNDSINGNGGNDILVGGLGKDTLLGAAGNDTIYGYDPLYTTGTDLGNSIDGGDGADSLIGANAADTILGGIGNDTIRGNAGNDSINAGNDNDVVIGGSGADTILGGSGNDSIDGGTENDSINGGAGIDTILGGSGNDSIDGGTEGDSITGGLGNDTLIGNSGNDSLIGGENDDVLRGGTGNDLLFGDAGFDTFEFSSTAGSNGQDTIADSDGLGAIKIGTAILSGQAVADATGWTLGGYHIIADGSDMLISAGATDTIRIKDFAVGQTKLGITIPQDEPAIDKTFVFNTTVNISELGGATYAPLTMRYTFDTDLIPGSGSFGTSPTHSSFASISGTLSVGSESMAFTHGQINVFNNAGSIGIEDSYDVRFQGEGMLFGLPVDFMRFIIVDKEGTMFSNTDLPSAANFSTLADFQQVSVRLTVDADAEEYVVLRVSEFDNTPPEQLTPFSLTEDFL